MSEYKQAELLPCPFCGGEAERIKRESNFPYIHGVWCMECNCRTSFEKSEEIAIEKWNNRKPVDDVVEQLEEEMDTKITVYGGRLGGKTFVTGYYEGLRVAINIVKEEVRHEYIL